MRNTILKSDDTFKTVGISVQNQTVTLHNGKTVPISVFIQPLTDVSYDPDKNEFSEKIIRWDVRRLPDEGVLDGIGCGLEEWEALANAMKAQCAFA